MCYSAVDILCNGVSFFSASYMAPDMMSCGFFLGGEGQTDAFRWWKIFVLLAICISLWSFIIICHGYGSFSDCCSFSFHDYCKYTTVLVSQLASCLPEMMVLHGTIPELR